MKPFLKWAGNKYQIISAVQAALPPGERLVEPFVGSGAVFLNTSYPAYLLADANNDLISLYTHLQNQTNDFIQYCKTFFTGKTNCQEIFYEYRDRFNATPDEREKAALFVYLNKHSFNGLCRYNARGEFNAPFGAYKKPYFPEKEMTGFYQKTAACSVEFICSEFRETFTRVKNGDVVYCDPPYVPLSQTANFTNYSAGGFSSAEQEELASLAVRCSRKGIPVVISNHDTVFTREIYSTADIETLTVRRFISCDGKNRNKVAELLAAFKGDLNVAGQLG